MYEKIIEWWQSQCHSQINMCCHYCDKRFEPKTAPTLEAEEARKAWLGATCGIGWHACNEDIPAKRRDARNVRYKWTKTEQCSSSVVQTKGVANRREYTRVEWEVRPNIRFLWWERLSGDVGEHAWAQEAINGIGDSFRALLKWCRHQNWLKVGET